MILALCSMLLHFASMPVPKALLGAGVAFRAFINMDFGQFSKQPNVSILGLFECKKLDLFWGA